MSWLLVKPHVAWALGGVFALLLIATVAVQAFAGGTSETTLRELRLRIRSWWLMAGIFAFALTLSRNVSLGFFAFVSFLALKEYLSLIPTRRSDRRVLFWAYLTIPLQYLWAGMAWYGMFIIFVPVFAFLFLPMRMVLIGDTHEFLRAAGTLHWGLMTTVFSISHVAFLLVLSEQGNPMAGGAGLVLFLVFLTEVNDVAQYVWGKLLGLHRIIPKVSPNKTWEGFLGGLATTVALAWLLAPWLTPLNPVHALIAGGNDRAGRV